LAVFSCILIQSSGYKEQVPVLTLKKTSQHIKGDFLHNDGFIPIASPEEFAMVGAVSAVSQQFDKPVDCTGMADTYGQYHRPEIAISVQEYIVPLKMPL